MNKIISSFFLIVALGVPNVWAHTNFQITRRALENVKHLEGNKCLSIEDQGRVTEAIKDLKRLDFRFFAKLKYFSMRIKDISCAIASEFAVEVAEKLGNIIEQTNCTGSELSGYYRKSTMTNPSPFNYPGGSSRGLKWKSDAEELITLGKQLERLMTKTKSQLRITRFSYRDRFFVNVH